MTIYQISKERIEQIEGGIGSLRSHHLVVQKFLLLKMSDGFPLSLYAFFQKRRDLLESLRRSDASRQSEGSRRGFSDCLHVDFDVFFALNV